MMRSMLRPCGMAPSLERASRVRRPVQMNAGDTHAAPLLEVRARKLRIGRQPKAIGQIYMHTLYVLA